MTVSSTTNRWSYTGNGATVAFTYGSRVFAATDLKVFVNGALQALGSHYTVSGVGQDAGGSVTFTTPPANGAAVVFVRDVPATQGTDFAPLGSFPAEENEKALDRLTVLVQQIMDGSARGLRQPLSDPAIIAALPDRTTRATTYLAFDANGDPLAAASPVGGAVVSTFMSTLLDDATAAAARTTLEALGASDPVATGQLPQRIRTAARLAMFNLTR